MPPKKPAAGPAAAPSQSSDDAPSKEKKSGWRTGDAFTLQLSVMGQLVSVSFAVCLDAPSARKSAAHPSTVIMVKEALKALDSRKGVSSKAMQNYIKQKYPSVDVLRLKHLVRRALKKGIESGTLVRPANSNVSTGATGKFRVTWPNWRVSEFVVGLLVWSFCSCFTAGTKGQGAKVKK